MTPQERQEFEQMKAELAMFRKFFVVSNNRINLRGTVVVDGLLNADRVYTQRSGSYVELTT